MQNKTFKTLDEQIEIMKSKGLNIIDVDKAKNILFRENYFFINGYRQLLMYPGEKKFIKGSTFDELYGIFVFDRKIRNIFFKYILIIENNVKSIMSYYLSKKYGYKEKEYLKDENFIDDPSRIKQVHDVISKMKRQIRINGSQHRATAHYVYNYGYIPLWVLVKVLSFGIVAELYGILKDDDKASIANVYEVDTETFLIFLSLLANFRNICAHEDIFFDHRTGRKIPDNKFHKLLDIDTDEDGYIFGKNDLYALVLIMKYMLSETEFRDLIHEINYELDVLNGKVNSVSIVEVLKKIGFPINWTDILDL